METEFLIVGGGLGGGVLAALLGRAGRRVTVLERNVSGTPLVRPEVLWPATIDLLSSLLPRQALLDSVVPVRGLHIFRGSETFVKITPETLARSGVQPCSTDPDATRAKLLELGSFEVKRGVEAVAVVKEGNRVTGVRARETATGREFEVNATWVIGDDGAHSMVRAACGIELQTQLFPVEFLCFGFDWPDSLPQGWPHAFLNPHPDQSFLLAVGGLPLPQGRGAGLVTVHGTRMAAATDADIEAAWGKLLQDDPRIAELTIGKTFPRDFIHVKRVWGHARHYGGEGAVLLGDAIHPVSPVGGQGANMSAQDARVLAEILLSGRQDPVEEYERRRRRANARSLGFTRLASDVFEGSGIGRFAGVFSGLVPTLINLPLIQRTGLRFISRAFQS